MGQVLDMPVRLVGRAGLELVKDLVVKGDEILPQNGVEETRSITHGAAPSG